MNKKEPSFDGSFWLSRREGSRSELNLSRSFRASTKRPFAKFANPIFALQKDGSINEGRQK
jgi:hypothetical protein